MTIHSNRRVQRTNRQSLRRVSLLSACSDPELDTIDKNTTRATVASGTTIARENEWGKEVLLIIDGIARVEQRDTTVARLGAGSVFGEASVIDGTPRNASVVAETDLTVLAMSRPEFTTIMDNCPTLRDPVEETHRRRTAPA